MKMGARGSKGRGEVGLFGICLDVYGGLGSLRIGVPKTYSLVPKSAWRYLGPPPYLHHLCQI